MIFGKMAFCVTRLYFKEVSWLSFLLKELDAIVSTVHAKCVNNPRTKMATLDKLKRIELRMELLTKELEILPEDKVKIAQRVREALLILKLAAFCSLSSLFLRHLRNLLFELRRTAVRRPHVCRGLTLEQVFKLILIRVLIA